LAELKAKLAAEILASGYGPDPVPAESDDLEVDFTDAVVLAPEGEGPIRIDGSDDDYEQAEEDEGRWVDGRFVPISATVQDGAQTSVPTAPTCDAVRDHLPVLASAIAMDLTDGP